LAVLARQSNHSSERHSRPLAAVEPASERWSVRVAAEPAPEAFNKTGSTLDIFTPSFLLAQAPTAPAPAADQGPQLLQLFIPVVAAIALYYFMFLRPERRKAAGQRSRLDSLKKNDRVVTIGGIYGLVVNVNRDADEVTLKIDEATNTKLRVTFGAIARVVGDEPSSDKTAST
jgi:preprotein translocase subunit YajC